MTDFDEIGTFYEIDRIQFEPGGKSTTTRKAGGLDLLAAVLAAGQKIQKHCYAAVLNLQ